MRGDDGRGLGKWKRDFLKKSFHFLSPRTFRYFLLFRDVGVSTFSVLLSERSQTIHPKPYVQIIPIVFDAAVACDGRETERFTYLRGRFEA